MSHTQQANGGFRGSRRFLTGANFVLAGAALTMVVAGIAGAQPRQSGTLQRASGQYTCVGGQTLGGYTNVIYVLDSANRELVVLKWNDGTKQLEGIGYRDLVSDISKESDR